MAYFAILNGLRGCYMPDSAAVIQCGTRRELKAAISDECLYNGNQVYVGLNNRAIAWAAAKAWRDRKHAGRQLAILPYGRRGESPAYSIEIHGATAADFQNQGDL